METNMKTEMSFEACMDALEGIVKGLESGNLPLSEMVELYEHGAALGKKCMAMLDAFEGKLEILEQEGGK